MNPIIPRNPDKSVNWEILSQSLPNFGDMHTCPQEPEHHAEGNVLTHTKMVTEEGLKLAKSHGLNKEEEEDLLFACAHHDIGKPITLKKEDDGKWSSRMHAVKGTAFLRYTLWEQGSHIPLQRREKLLALITLHAWPVRFLERDLPADSIIRASLMTSNKLLGLLAIADMTGRVCQDKTAQSQAIDAAKLFLEYSQELGCLDRPYDFGNEHSKLHFLQTTGDPTLTLFDPSTFQVTMMCGIPCSGKDHWLAKNYEHPIISRDQIRKDLKFPNEGEVLQELTSQIKKALAKKEPFAINATNLRRELRAGYANLISAYKGRTKMVYLQADLPEINRRISSREKSLPEKEKIPHSAILKMAASCEPPTALECHSLNLLDTNPQPKKAKVAPEPEICP